MEFYEPVYYLLTILLLLLNIKDKLEGFISRYKKILLVDLPAW
jgi:hypothetical protein